MYDHFKETKNPLYNIRGGGKHSPLCLRNTFLAASSTFLLNTLLYNVLYTIMKTLLYKTLDTVVYTELYTELLILL